MVSSSVYMMKNRDHGYCHYLPAISVGPDKQSRQIKLVLNECMWYGGNTQRATLGWMGKLRPKWLSVAHSPKWQSRLDIKTYLTPAHTHTMSCFCATT